MPKVLAVDTETSGLTFYDEAFAVTTAWEEDGVLQSEYFDVDTQKDEIIEVLGTASKLVFHNAKFDLQKLQLADIIRDRVPFEDTEALAHLLDEHRPKRLKYLAREILGVETSEEEELKKICRKLKIKKADGYAKIPREILIPYAVKDAEYTLELFNVLFAQMQRKDDALRKLYEVERELTWVLLDMEQRGMGVDREYVTSAKTTYAASVFAAEIRCREAAQEETFNPRSNPQVRGYFAAKEIIREKYDKNSLLEITDPMAEALLDLRKDEKILKTYLMPLLQESESDGLLHPHFRQYKPITGRMASGKVEE